MSKKTLYILGILLTILIGTLLYRPYCCKCKSVAKGVTTGNEISSKFAMTGNGFNYRCRDNFKFPVNGSDPVLPVGDSVDLGIKLLKDNFNSDPSQKLVITGYCTPSETNGSAFSNLGLARAKALEGYFVAKGFPVSSTEISGEIKEGLYVKDKFVMGPVDLKIIQVEKKPGQIVLYFNLGQKQVVLSPEQARAVTDMAKYFEKVPAARLSITGYTDNIGDRAANVRLGQERANWAKTCFMKNGIAENKIECSSSGPDDPVGDNATAKGQAQNRRTVITIK